MPNAVNSFQTRLQFEFITSTMLIQLHSNHYKGNALEKRVYIYLSSERRLFSCMFEKLL